MKASLSKELIERARAMIPTLKQRATNDEMERCVSKDGLSPDVPPPMSRAGGPIDAHAWAR